MAKCSRGRQIDMTALPTLIRLTLAHPEGLHARVAAMWVQGLRDCEVEVTVSWDGRTVNGRSVIELLTLGAPHGSVLEVRISGADTEAALSVLRQVVERPSAG